jgi:hypothetical protein
LRETLRACDPYQEDPRQLILTLARDFAADGNPTNLPPESYSRIRALVKTIAGVEAAESLALASVVDPDPTKCESEMEYDNLCEAASRERARAFTAFKEAVKARFALPKPCWDAFVRDLALTKELEARFNVIIGDWSTCFPPGDPVLLLGHWLVVRR